MQLRNDFIPLNNLQRHVNSVAEDLREAMESVLVSGQYILGPCVERFEADFSAYCGTQHAVGVANGTDALELALLSAGCKAEDEVITVANAGGYATNAILQVGAVPVYADINPQTFLMTADGFCQLITPKTKAVIVTHLFGLMADMPALCQIADNYGIAVIEDCAQAHGASIEGKKAGTWGALGCFSFYPTKNLGALGDAGCIITHDPALAEKLRGLRQYGWRDTKYHSPHDIGCNSRMDEMQAAMLSRLLLRLDQWNRKRREIIKRYKMALFSDDVIFQNSPDDESFVAHLCVVVTKDRESTIQNLNERRIASTVHYSMPDYAQPAVIRRIGPRAPLPVTEQVRSRILSIPCFPEMTEDEVDRVIAAVQHPKSQAVL